MILLTSSVSTYSCISLSSSLTSISSTLDSPTAVHPVSSTDNNMNSKKYFIISSPFLLSIIVNCRKKLANDIIYGDPESIEILIEDGRFKAIGNNLGETDEVIDLEGKLVLPPYVDPHLHLDYIFSGLGEGNANISGTLFEGIERWSDNKKSLTEEMVRERALQGIKKELNHGVQYIRTHVDITDPHLTGMKALLKLREELKDVVTLQLVAFPQEGFFRYEGAEELMIQ